jgi:hypothetical protein
MGSSLSFGAGFARAQRGFGGSTAVQLEAGEFERIPQERASPVELGCAETIAAPPGSLLGGGGDLRREDQLLHLVLRRLGLKRRRPCAKKRWFCLDLGECGATVGWPGTKVGVLEAKVGEHGANVRQAEAKDWHEV